MKILLMLPLFTVVFITGCTGTLNNDTANDTTNKTFCTPDQRAAEFCIEIYQPVCGFFDPEQIQCVKAPCAATFSNSCFACQDPTVLYWEEGECPV